MKVHCKPCFIFMLRTTGPGMPCGVAEPRSRGGHGPAGRGSGRRNMATYVEIIRHEFPDIDLELFQYVTGEVAGLLQPCVPLPTEPRPKLRNPHCPGDSERTRRPAYRRLIDPGTPGVSAPSHASGWVVGTKPHTMPLGSGSQ